MKKLLNWIYSTQYIMYNPDPRMMYQAYKAQQLEKAQENQDQDQDQD